MIKNKGEYKKYLQDGEKYIVFNHNIINDRKISYD